MAQKNDTNEFIYSFKVNALRTLNSPYKNNEDKSETIYTLLVNMRDLPGDLPLDVNPREQKMTTTVAKKLKDAVRDSEQDFYLNNRGIVIAAKDLTFDTQRSVVSINLGDQDTDDDKYTYGILDGGHTYRAIISERDSIPYDLEKYVRVEVITNVQNITRLSDARNTSVQVTDIALFNLDDKFDNVKAAIATQPYAEKVAYKDNENKELHVYDLLRLMFAVDKEKYPDDSVAPIQSYSGKAQVFKRYKEAYNTTFYKSLVTYLPMLVSLYDTIECEIAERYREYKLALGGSKPNFGNIRGVEVATKNAKSTFLNKPIDYSVSTGYLYPIFGAFRYLVEIDEDGSVNWMFNPLEVWNEIGTSLVQNTFETYTNPNLAGKDKQLWLSNYRIVETQSLRKLLQRR